jgi:hypothetical protein
MNATLTSKALSLLCVVYLASTGGALATEPAGDAQTQARIFLTGKGSGGPDLTAPSVASSSTASTSSAIDAQELVRRVLLGQPTTDAAIARLVAPGSTTIAERFDRDVDGDAQEMARRAILGSVSKAVSAAENLNSPGSGSRKLSLNGGGSSGTAYSQP